MAKKLKLVDDSEDRIKKALITQNTLARALRLSDPLFTKKLKRYNNQSFTIEEAKILETMLRIKLLEPDNKLQSL